MADEKLTQKTENSSPELTDIMEIVDLGGAPLSQKITLTNLFSGIPSASTSVSGIVELGTIAETNTGTDPDKAVSLDGLAGSNLGSKSFGWVVFPSDEAVTTKTGTDGIPMPASMNGMNVIDVLGAVDDKGITGTTDLQLVRRRAGSEVNVLSVAVTIGDEFFANDGTINTSNDDILTGDIFYLNVTGIHSGTAPNGLDVVVTAGLP